MIATQTMADTMQETAAPQEAATPPQRDTIEAPSARSARAVNSDSGRKSTGWRAVGAAPRVLAAEIGSRFLYVAEQGSMLRKEGSRLRIVKNGSELLRVSAMRLQVVAIYGNVQISTQCLRTLLEEGVSLAIFSRNGTFRGRLVPAQDSGALLRRRQWERAADPAFCLQFGRAVVRGKLLGARQVAAAYAKNYLAATLGSAHTVLQETLDRLNRIADLDELRGAEGAAARAWFDLLRRCNRSKFVFEERSGRAASDPLNVLLNLGYTMVLRELEGLLWGAGLDACVGFFHTSHGNRPALACDLVEEFRHALVDRLVLKLVNLGTIREEHFIDQGERGLRFTPEGVRTFVAAYEQALLSGDGSQPGGYRGVFLQQLGRLMDALAERAAYRAHQEDVAAQATPAPVLSELAGSSDPNRESGPGEDPSCTALAGA